MLIVSHQFPFQVAYLLDIWKGRQSNELILCQNLVESLKEREDCNLLVARLLMFVHDQGLSVEAKFKNWQ